MRASKISSAIAAGLLLLSSATSALAHGELVGTSPSPGDTVAGNQSICVEYSEAILLEGSAIVLANAAGEPIGTGETWLNENSLCADWPTDAQPGEISVSYRVVGADGHNVSDEFVFTYEPSAPEPTVVIAPAPSPTPTSVAVDSSGTALWTGLGFLAIAVVLLGLWLNRKEQ